MRSLSPPAKLRRMAVATAPALAENVDAPPDWLDELQEVAARTDLLTPAAQAALLAVVDSFAAEDGFLHPTAREARIALLGARRLSACSH